MKFPFTMQQGKTDCGPTCLKMIADYYGLNYELGFLKRKCHVKKDGVSMLDLSKAAASIGFECTGAKVNIEQLKEIVQDVPVILYCNKNHFIVIYKAPGPKKAGLFYIADPANGLVKYKKWKLITYWVDCNFKNKGKIRSGASRNRRLTGYCLLLEPTERLTKIVGVAISKN